MLKPIVGFFAVTAAWLAAAIAGAVPLMVSGTFDSPINGFFEAMSGFTTTGASVLPTTTSPTPSSGGAA